MKIPIDTISKVNKAINHLNPINKKNLRYLGVSIANSIRNKRPITIRFLFKYLLKGWSHIFQWPHVIKVISLCRTN